MNYLGIYNTPALEAFSIKDAGRGGGRGGDSKRYGVRLTGIFSAFFPLLPISVFPK